MANTEYQANLAQLLQNNIKYQYAYQFASYPSTHITYYLDLLSFMSDDDAFEILNSIPALNKQHNMEILFEDKVKIIKCNYTWCKQLYKYNININIIKELLNKYIDYYYIEIIYLNKQLNDCELAFNRLKENYHLSIHHCSQYYKLRINKINHIHSFAWSRFKIEIIDNIIALHNIGYDDFEFLNKVYSLSQTQIDFLKLSRLAYVNDEEFKANKVNIYYNVFKNNLIEMEPFIFVKEYEINKIVYELIQFVNQ